MTTLDQAAEERFGIKVDPGDVKRLQEYIWKTYGSENAESINKIFSSGEAASFLTVNETYFFREPAHFTFLWDLLPSFKETGIQICCAAVAAGCEAYSIAMLIEHQIQKGLNIDFAVDAFDVNGESIETAKNARFTSNTIRTDGSSWKFILDSYLIPDNNEYIVSQEICKRVNFFPHNIMRGLEKQYDIIFYRNSLIYFSSRSRLSVLNNLADALFNNGLLFLGVSETSSVNHPLLVNRFLSDVFYFQKIEIINSEKQIISTIEAKKKTAEKPAEYKPPAEKPVLPVKTKSDEISINCAEISKILKTGEGKPNAENALKIIITKEAHSISASNFAACAVYFLNSQDFNIADKVISHLEKINSGAFTRFLRGEYHFLLDNPEEAEKYYNEAAVKDKIFWPAFYRISSIAADGNRTRYEYKIKKAIESIESYQSAEADKKLNYECFMGGFSSDYFQRILEKKLTEKEV